MLVLLWAYLRRWAWCLVHVECEVTMREGGRGTLLAASQGDWKITRVFYRG